MQVTETNHVPIKAWVDGVVFEDAASRQVENVASLPFVYRHVAVMPDVHWGMGATVGSVIATGARSFPRPSASTSASAAALLRRAST
jgi:tRNA-splicing ligase RtcB